MNYYSKELKESIKNDYVNGLSIDFIGEKYKLGLQTIRYILKKINVYQKTKSRNIWTDTEKENLKTFYSKYDFSTIEKLIPNHSHKSIVHMCHKLNLNRNEYRKNNKKKLDNKIYDDKIIFPKRELVIKEKEPVIIYPKYKNPSRKSRDVWYTLNEMDFIIKNWKNMSDSEIGMKIERTTKSVQAKRLELGIKRQGNSSYYHLQDFIRKNNTKWKILSMKKCEYKCVISGKHFDEIHHIVGFNYILDIALVELKFGFKYDVRFYTDDELEMILNKFREVQERFPLGVCLTKKLHEKFHCIYGYGNNTKKQWDEFYNNNI